MKNNEINDKLNSEFKKFWENEYKQDIRSFVIDYSELFNNRKYYIPEYQRDFVWSSKDVFDLIDSLIWSIKNKKDFFIGSMLIKEGRGNSYAVIDGQQRITTFFMVLTALKKYLLKDENKNFNDINKINDLLTEEQRGKMPKLRLRYESTDDNDLLRIFEYHTVKDDFLNKTLFSVNNSIQSKMFEKFKEIEKNTNPLEPIMKMKLNLIIVVDKINPNAIFESMNSTGVDLSVEELLRNYFFDISKGMEKNQIQYFEILEKSFSFIMEKENLRKKISISKKNILWEIYYRQKFKNAKISNFLSGTSSFPKEEKKIFKLIKNSIEYNFKPSEENLSVDEWLLEFKKYISNELNEMSKVFNIYLKMEEQNLEEIEDKRTFIIFRNLLQVKEYAALTIIFLREHSLMEKGIVEMLKNKKFINFLESMEKQMYFGNLVNYNYKNIYDIYDEIIKTFKEKDSDFYKKKFFKLSEYDKESLKNYVMNDNNFYINNSKITRNLFIAIENAKGTNNFILPWEKENNKVKYTVDHIICKDRNKNSEFLLTENWSSHISNEVDLFYVKYLNNIGNLTLEKDNFENEEYLVKFNEKKFDNGISISKDLNSKILNKEFFDERSESIAGKIVKFVFG